jgi:hypothetical protein
MKHKPLNGQELQVLRQNHNKFLELFKEALGYLAVIAIFFFLSLMFIEKLTSEVNPVMEATNESIK